jgi:polyphosphate kinase
MTPEPTIAGTSSPGSSPPGSRGSAEDPSACRPPSWEAGADDRDRFINRELSWIEFNARVLEEAGDRRRPLLERLKFLSIFSSNLDEFFMIRISGLRHRDPDEVSSDESGDRLSTREVLAESSRRIHRLVAEQSHILLEELLPELAKAGIRKVSARSVKGDAARALDTFFLREVLPVLTPLVIDPAHPFPHVQNRQLYLASLLKAKAAPRLRVPRTCLGIVPIPPLLPRFIPVSAGEGKDTFVALEDLVGNHLERLFSGFEATEPCVFRLTRDQDFELADQDSADLVKQIESQLHRRRRGAGVRLEFSSGLGDRLRKDLLRWFDIDPSLQFEIDGPLDLSAFRAWVGLPGYAALHDPPSVSHVAAPIAAHKGDLFSLIRSGDLLLHHPYESFDSVVEFLEEAAEDPHVLAIKQTLYRAGRNSPVVAALTRAAERDKEVTALIELQARFDEEANIEWARTLERAGAHIVYGLPGLKTHCKVAMVVRRDPDRIRRYVHLSTGNYNPFTARIYTDLGLLTCDDLVGEDAAALFNMMTGYAQPAPWHRLQVAPFGLREWAISCIEREAEHRRAGRPARIIAKMNGLVDREVIRALYRASQAGVPIDIIVRGICCLRPGVQGVSEHIRVRSVVGRFLEHSRVSYFENGGRPEVYLSSADWMPRNFDRRVEVAFPVETPALKRRLVDEVLGMALRDEANARILAEDGSYRRLNGPFDSHAVLERIAAGVESALPLPP